jgi:hypothetical protein
MILESTASRNKNIKLIGGSESFSESGGVTLPVILQRSWERKKKLSLLLYILFFMMIVGVGGFSSVSTGQS